MRPATAKLRTTPPAETDPRWQAFLVRDRRFDGQFFFAVKTTGVYCRPSCAGRPKRENVAIYDSCDAAEQAGFRACKRCHPKGAAFHAE
jgi:AraC family transcriptional regulator of adaptative response/methylated-DNA-[protein]-cysteine methyltransferase